MALGDERKEWFKIGDVANRLNVGNHVVRHYTDKLADILGESIWVDPTNNFTMYNSEGIKVLANVRKMVQEDHMTLNEVRQELLKVDQSKLPAKFELDVAESFVYIKNVIEAQQEKIQQLTNVLGLLTGKLEGFEQLPVIVKAYHDEVNGGFQQLDRMKQDISTVNELKDKLFEYEKENTQMRQLVVELKERMDRTEQFEQKLTESVGVIMDKTEKHWATLSKIEKQKESVKKKWWNIFG